MARPDLKVIRANEHNLQDVSLTIPRGSLTVITGLSGSGKSSLAFDTIYAEGQRRYIESVSSYARQFLGSFQRPNVEHIEGLSPAVSIEQKTGSRNPRSTVGTVSEIYDYLRVLYSTIGLPHCPHCGRPLESQTNREIVERIMSWPTGTRLMIMAPIVRGRKGIYRKELHEAQQAGFVRAKIDGEMRMLDESISLARNKTHTIQIVVDRIILTSEEKPRVESAVDVALQRSDRLVTVEVIPGRDGDDAKPKGKKKSASDEDENGVRLGEYMFSEAHSCPEHGPQLVEVAPRLFSFNSVYGCCPNCKGIGSVEAADDDLIAPDPELSINEGAIAPWEDDTLESPLTLDGRKKEARLFRQFCDDIGVDLDKPWGKLNKKVREEFLRASWKEPGKRGRKIDVKGVALQIEEMMADEEIAEWRLELLEQYASYTPCPKCNGARLKPASLGVTLRGKNIAEFCDLSVGQARQWFDSLTWEPREWEIGQQVIEEIRDRLRFLDDIGVGYLSLNRTAGTLAGGEMQRIRLATQIGSQLTGVLYVLDEPSIGLHMRDNHRLIEALQKLRKMGNTVIVVEHDEATMKSADFLVDLGPGAGRLGGKLMAAGSPDKVLTAKESLTAQYLTGKKLIEPPKKRRTPDKKQQLVVRGASEHNLKNIDVALPLGLFTCITGVSGSGKSTLVNDILFPAVCRQLNRMGKMPGRHKKIDGADQLDKIIDVDQSPIGRTPRSNAATYTGLFTPIRELFAQLNESRIRGWKAGHFSFNVKGGRCEACRGAGSIKMEMAFLPNVYVTCEECRGRRYNAETLTVTYKGKTIADVLEMPIGEAVEFFDPISKIRAPLQTLCDIGLDYLHLGQPATTLSGGEAQRIKLARELTKRQTGQTLYILDEPTTGLHFEDIKKLIDVLQRLVNAGNSVVVVEHNLDVIKCADWVIDLGPEGGDGGGRIVAEGTPEKVAATKASFTGHWLKDVLK
jgi:excinuclease ABC subunit A